MDRIKVKNNSGRIFYVVYVPEQMCWIEEGTNYYYSDEDWQWGVIKKVKDDDNRAI